MFNLLNFIFAISIIKLFYKKVKKYSHKIRFLEKSENLFHDYNTKNNILIYLVIKHIKQKKTIN
jgi:hypothetical protein